MAASKNHHTVAQSLLVNFCYAESKIWYFSKRRQNEGVCSRDIQRKFRRIHYYSLKNSLGERDDVIERTLFQVLDSKFALVSREICIAVLGGKIPNFDEDTLNLIRVFLYYQAKRSPDFSVKIMNGIDTNSQVRSAILEYERKFGSVSEDEKKRLQTAEMVSDIYEFARVSNTARASAKILEIFRSMQICYALSGDRTEFIIGSNPVIRFENKANAFLGDGNVELWSPISPKVAIGLVGPMNFGFDLNRPLVLRQGLVRLLNEQIYKNSSEVGSSKEKLLRSIVYSKMTGHAAHH